MKLWSTLIAATLLAVFSMQTVEAKKLIDEPNGGYCKNGKHVRDVAKCKENRDKKH